MESTKWYEKTWLLILACVIFFPVGLYGVYKSQKINKNFKYEIFGFFAVLIVGYAFLGKPQDVESKKENTVEEDSTSKINELVADSVRTEQVSRILREQERRDQPTKCYLISRRYLKNNLNDKDSYDEDTHEEFFVTKKSKKDPYIQVKIRYRAKNGFGAIMLNETFFNFDESLNMIGTYSN